LFMEGEEGRGKLGAKIRLSAGDKAHQRRMPCSRGEKTGADAKRLHGKKHVQGRVIPGNGIKVAVLKKKKVCEKIGD